MSKKDKKGKKEKYNLITNLRFLLSNSWCWDKGLFGLCLVSTAVNSLHPFIPIFVPKLIIDELTGLRRPDYIIIVLFTTTVLGIILHVISAHTEDMLWYKAIGIRCKFMLQQGLKVMEMPFEMTESPEVLDKFEKAKTAVGDRISVDARGVEGIISLLFNLPAQLIGLIGFIAIVSVLNPIILLFLIFCVAANYFLNLKISGCRYKINEQMAPINRRGYYYSERAFDFKFGKDIRIFKIGELLMGKLNEAANSRIELFKKLAEINLKLNTIGYFVDLLKNIVTYGYLAYSVVYHGMGIGDCTMYIAAINAFSRSLKEIMNSISELNHKNMYVNDFREFMEISSKKETETVSIPDKGVQLDFEFQNVSFKYPGSNEYVFQDLSMKISSGEKLALVGVNGAGKTTLVKLLTRLYEPCDGRILLNGTDIKRFDREEYFKLFSVVFQDINMFAFKVSENVALQSENEINRDRVQECIDQAGLSDRVGIMKNSIDTNMLKVIDENGVDFSGGEAQKLAIARALYKNSPFVILDEPTSALDPIAEHNIYMSFSSLIGSKTALFISHRLSSTRFCDRVIYLEGGEILEYGTHKELMNRNGKYAGMFNMQASYYKESEERNEITLEGESA